MKEDALFTYKQAGGFIGAGRSYQQRLADLPRSDQETLAKLIEKSGLLNAAAPEKITRGARDVFYYDFSVTESGKTYRARFDDTTLPDSYRPLVEFLKDKVIHETRS